MRRGKEIAQGAHASMMWLVKRLEPAGELAQPVLHGRFSEAELTWMCGSFKKVTCQAPNNRQLYSLMQRAEALGVMAHLVTDSGLTEFHGNPTVTAIAIGPDWEDLVDRVTGDLELY